MAAETKSEVKPESFPVGASFGLGYSANHANLVNSNGDFGSQSMSIRSGVNYKLPADIGSSLSVSAGKTIIVDYLNRGAASSTSRTPWELRNISLGFSRGLYKLEASGISFGSSLGFTVPTSKAARSAGLITTIGPGLSANWKSGGLTIGVNGGYTYFINKDATVQIDCDIAPENCEISGTDTAIPNALHNLSTGLAVNYRFKFGLTTGVNYGIANGFSAVKFKKDEFSAPIAQEGLQTGLGRQTFSARVGYSILPKTSISLRMTTGGGIYSNDNRRYRFPLFDTESNLHHRTTYGFSLNQRI